MTRYAQHRVRKSPFQFRRFLLTEIPRTGPSSLPVKTMYSNTIGIFSYSSRDEKVTLPARDRSRASRVSRVAEKRFSRREEVLLPARAAERSTSLSTPKSLRRLRRRTRT